MLLPACWTTVRLCHRHSLVVHCSRIAFIYLTINFHHFINSPITMTTLSTLLTLATLIPQSFEIITSRSLDHRTSCPSGKTLPPGHLNPTLMAPIVASAPNFVFSGTQVPLITPNDICTIFDHVSRPLPSARRACLNSSFRTT